MWVMIYKDIMIASHSGQVEADSESYLQNPTTLWALHPLYHSIHWDTVLY
jgi:hypothetical protein